MKDSILGAAMQVANLKGLTNVTRNDIADRLEIATGSVSYHYGDMRKLRTAMVERAVESQNLKIVGQAIAIKHPIAMKAPEALRVRAVRVLAGC
jgi:AcrR family transcriptional regulator